MTKLFETWPVRSTDDGDIQQCEPRDAHKWGVYWREDGGGPATWILDMPTEMLAEEVVDALNILAEDSTTPQLTLNSCRTACFSRAQLWLPIDAATPIGVKVQLINKNANVAQYGQYTGKPGFWTHWAPLPGWAEKST